MNAPRRLRLAGGVPLGLVVLAVLGAGCAHLGAERRVAALSVTDVVKEAHARGLPLTDPLTLDPLTAAHVREVIGIQGSPRERMRRIIRYLVDRGRMNFRYAPNQSLTAEQAFLQHTGDCMAYTNLYIAMARAVDLPMHFVRITDLPVYYERSGVFYVSSHMAAAYPTGGNDGFGGLVIDFSSETDNWRLGLYEPAPDLTAFALFYSNVAMDALVQGHATEAERTLSFLLEKTPNLRELYSNLGVVLMREGRAAAALSLLERGMALFPDYHPLYINAAQAARSLERAELADLYLARGASVATTDPFFLFSRGLSAYQKADYAVAVRQFQQAARAQPDNPVILSWMVRAYLSSGEKHRGKETYQRLVKVAPEHKSLAQLQQQFPELGTPARAGGS